MAICWRARRERSSDEPEPGRSAPQLRSRRPPRGGRGRPTRWRSSPPGSRLRWRARSTSPTPWRSRPWAPTGSRRPAWCCSRASMPRASSSTPTWRAARRRSSQAIPRASLLFWWDRLHRQVRIEGAVELVDAAEADAYFASRPHGSRIGAIASPQSRVIDGRAGLEARVAELAARHPEDVPRPRHWGGYRAAADAARVLAGPAQPPARPAALHPLQGRLADRAPGTVMC